jgi:Lon protease-like protein
MLNPIERLRGLFATPPHNHALPLFLLNAVLFPGGRLNLKVFEARYLDMVAECLRSEQPFGVCLIKEGAEVGAAAQPETVGCHARIVSADMDTPGMMHIEVRGEGRFVIEESHIEANQLRVATVRDKDDEAAMPVPAHCRPALTLLGAVAARAPDAGLGDIPDDASVVGFRLAEVLPLKTSARQALLEMNDGVKRLEILLEFMRRNGLT